MKTLVLIPVLLFSFWLQSQTSEKDIVGIWKTELKDAKIEIYKKNNFYYGKVVWIASPTDKNGKPIVDSNNPVEKLKTQPILGMDIITKMSYCKNEWHGGKIYDPKNGESYTCKLWLEHGKLKVRGYAGWFFDTKTWTKVA